MGFCTKANRVEGQLVPYIIVVVKEVNWFISEVTNPIGHEVEDHFVVAPRKALFVSFGDCHVEIVASTTEVNFVDKLGMRCLLGYHCPDHTGVLNDGDLLAPWVLFLLLLKRPKEYLESLHQVIPRLPTHRTTVIQGQNVVDILLELELLRRVHFCLLEINTPLQLKLEQI